MFHRCLEISNHNRTRRGLTFVELVVAMAVVAMVVGTLETLAVAVHSAFEYNESQGMALQHARVTLDRISRTADTAFANEQFPGFFAWTDQVGTWQYPETLVVWHPVGSPANPTGLPQFNELIVYCPSPANPNQLLEITVVGDTRTVPVITDQTTWANEIAAIKASKTNTQVVLTDMVRTCSTSASGGAVRGAVRFQTRLLPSDSSWSQYKGGTLGWKSLPWVQGQCGSQMGLRQSWLRMEVQLMPGANILGEKTAALQPVPYYGSVALYYGMHR